MNRRILVVDDSEVTRAILARTLRTSGYEVLEAFGLDPVAAPDLPRGTDPRLH